MVVVGSNFKYMLSISVFTFCSFFSARLAFSTTYLLPPPLLHFFHISSLTCRYLFQLHCQRKSPNIGFFPCFRLNRFCFVPAIVFFVLIFSSLLQHNMYQGVFYTVGYYLLWLHILPPSSLSFPLSREYFEGIKRRNFSASFTSSEGENMIFKQSWCICISCKYGEMGFPPPHFCTFCHEGPSVGASFSNCASTLIPPTFFAIVLIIIFFFFFRQAFLS